MEKLNNVTDIEKYLQAGILTQPFLEKVLILKKIEIDQKACKERGITRTRLQSLCYWIGHEIKYAGEENRDFINKNQFGRTAQEIWESKMSTGCTDYALLFATFARQLGVPTTILHTAQYEWVQKLLKGEDYKAHYGHTFCECFDEGDWILIDPTCRKVQRSYNLDLLETEWNVANSNQFLPYLRALDLGKRQSLKEHNRTEEKLCRDIFEKED